MIALLILGLASIYPFAKSMDGSGPHLFWRQAHHAYWGWLLCIAGYAFRLEPVLLLGIWLAWEDATQHYTQCKGYSLVHEVYGLVWRFPPVRAFNDWLDRVL